MKKSYYDNIIIGAGIYGLYSALALARKKRKVLIVEMDHTAFTRASYVNQARVHNGYHYPRSLSTAKKSSEYFEKFSKDFNFAINNKFTKIYSISKKFSYTSATQFKNFCYNANIPCKEVFLKDTLNSDTIEASFETQEYSFDAEIIKRYFLKELSKYANVKIKYNAFPIKTEKQNTIWIINLNDFTEVSTGCVLNTTYASTNQVAKLFGFEEFNIKYEICEIIVCDVSKNLRNIGITVMDGPFFSIMPFGLNGKHSLTSVTFTPHKTSYEKQPVFDCQKQNLKCTSENLQNCNTCPAHPKSAWVYMRQLTKNYLVNTEIKYLSSYFAIKPILKASEMDDSRPTIIKVYSNEPYFVSILSGKINTIYDLDDTLKQL